MFWGFGLGVLLFFFSLYLKYLVLTLQTVAVCICYKTLLNVLRDKRTREKSSSKMTPWVFWVYEAELMG